MLKSAMKQNCRFYQNADDLQSTKSFPKQKELSKIERYVQGRNEVTRRPGHKASLAPGARSKFGAPMLEPEAFRKEIYCIEESTCETVATFRRHQQTFGAFRSDWAPPEWSGARGIVPSCPPVVTLLVTLAELPPILIRQTLVLTCLLRVESLHTLFAMAVGLLHS